MRRTVELAAHSYHQMNGTEDYVARALQGVTQLLSTMSNPTLTTQISLPSQLSVPQAHEKSLCFEVLGPVHSLQRSQIYFVPKVSRSSTANGARSLPQLKTSFRSLTWRESLCSRMSPKKILRDYWMLLILFNNRLWSGSCLLLKSTQQIRTLHR